MIAGLFQLVAGAILWLKVPIGVRRVSLVLLVGGIAIFFMATEPPSLVTAISKNQQMIAMLAAIGLLRYSPRLKTAETIPQGPRAIWQTLFGLHWLASVINISSLLIFSDRLAEKNGHLKWFQGMMLSRGFSMAALWSPFFVAMGVALTYAPGADYRQMMLWGLPFSQVLLAGMICHVIRKYPDEVEAFRGYSFRLSTLIVPAGLAFGVIVLHQLFPRLSILTIITLLAPCYPLLANREHRPGVLLKRFVLEDLARMGPEVVLFASAGVLGSGLSVLVAGRFFNLTGTINPLLFICAGLALILIAASLGVHPVVGVTIVAGIASGIPLPADLLALSFLFGWGLGVLINPISGVHILLSGRYGYPGTNAWRLNVPFVVTAYILACGWFGIYWLLLGQ
ncbi:MAG: hypothetical protein C0619_10935 [Desulfuromonas sp.]|nr:MAG: hypothetical protein C0619_10935 [Desulfuromonas sp.]